MLGKINSEKMWPEYLKTIENFASNNKKIKTVIYLVNRIGKKRKKLLDDFDDMSFFKWIFLLKNFFLQNFLFFYFSFFFFFGLYNFLLKLSVKNAYFSYNRKKYYIILYVIFLLQKKKIKFEFNTKTKFL